MVNGRVARPLVPAWRHIVDDDPCAYCYRTTQSLDHVVPKSRGGDLDGLNVTGSCFACNRAKADLSLLEFLVLRANGDLPWEPKYVTKGDMRARALVKAERRKLVQALGVAEADKIARRTKTQAEQTAARERRRHPPLTHPLRDELIRAGVIRPAGEQT